MPLVTSPGAHLEVLVSVGDGGQLYRLSRGRVGPGGDEC